MELIDLVNSVIIVGLASASSYKIGVVGNDWLVGNAAFSDTALKIFLIFFNYLRGL